MSYDKLKGHVTDIRQDGIYNVTPRTDRSDRSLSRSSVIDPNCRYEMCRICDLNSTDPTQETCPTVDHADYAAPTRQHELDHTDHTDHTDQEYIFPERSRS